MDTVLSFEGDRHHALRLLRAVKHRYGPTSELGLFEMAESGLAGVADASRLFLSDRVLGIPGSVVVPTLEGHRPLLVEVQALVVPSPLPTPRRSAQGFDQGRLALLVAVLGNRVGLPFVDRDVYASVVGGVRLGEPGSDLGICLALASALTSTAVPGDLIACGEVGLGGELRQVAQTPRRLAEAARLGFRRAIVPASAPEVAGDLELIRVTSVAEAVHAAGLSAGRAKRDAPAPLRGAFGAHLRPRAAAGRPGGAGGGAPMNDAAARRGARGHPPGRAP